MWRLPSRPGPTFAVASLPARSVLKILVCQDRHYDNRRDADHQALIGLHEFGPKLAGAHRIGAEARSLIAPANLRFVRAVLHSPDKFDLLAADMGGLVPENQSLLAAYRAGFGQSHAASPSN
jgi:hypothetical protein